MTYLASDKIPIFISSRLEECVEERIIAKSAIESLNCQPIMFEAAGARPHPPRSVYLRGVENALFFVGIYKEGYGYVADGMDISGLEDEYRYSKNVGTPQLLYVRKGSKRDIRLEKLIAEFYGSSTTVSFYEAPGELYEKLRDDITALISGYVLRNMRLFGSAPSEPSVVIEGLVGVERLLRRTNLEKQLLEVLQTDPSIVVSAPMGAGKTVFLAEMARQYGWIYIQCRGKTPREILLESANGVRAKLGLGQIGFEGLRDAKPALRAGWSALTAVTLVLDDVREMEMASAVRDIIKIEQDHHLIMSTRQPFLLPPATLFDIPPLGHEEIREFVKLNRSEPMLPGELEELAFLSEGNPLYLRYYAEGKPRHFQRSITEYELKAWRELGPKSREALSYIALSIRPLRLEEILQLMPSEAGIEDISENMFLARNITIELQKGYSFFHPHIKETIRTTIAKSGQLLTFYSERLSKWFSRKHDYIAAFAVLDSNGLDIPANLLEMAGRHAAVQGDVIIATRVLESRIRTARKAGAPELGTLMVLLADTLSLAGKTDEALQILREVRSLSDPPDLPIPLDEIELRILAWAKGDPDAINTLEVIKEQYIRDGKVWDAARVGLDLSVSLIRRGDYPQAAEEAEFALNTFLQQGDTYGVRIARLNLLSATSAIPEKSDIAANLLKELESDAEILPRDRAALCNVMGRLTRENNDVEEAKAYAREAIQIGRELGDVSVVCSNRINLGNAFRQEGNSREALEQYAAADKIARESGLVQSEAWAQELIASVYNTMGDGKRAMHHAQYAIGLVKEGKSKRTEVEAYEELAEACELANDLPRAREAWLRLAELELSLQRTESGTYAFLRAARLFYTAHARAPYINAYRKLLSLKMPDNEGLSGFEILVNELQAILGFVPTRYAFEAAVYHARLTFDGIPKALARQAYLRMMRNLANPKNGQVERLNRLRAALAVSMGLPQNTLAICDIAEVSEYLSLHEPSLSFRARGDGAAHLAVNLDFGKPVMVTISQLDDRPDVSLVSLCLALALLSFSEEISEEVFAGIKPPRSEAYMYAVNYNEAKKHVQLQEAGLHSMENACAVTRATNTKNDPSPIVVITRANLTADWLVGGGRGNSGQILFAEVLLEFVYHLFEGEIEIETLRPKVVAVVRKTIV